jgi:hypothetical protein
VDPTLGTRVGTPVEVIDLQADKFGSGGIIGLPSLFEPIGVDESGGVVEGVFDNICKESDVLVHGASFQQNEKDRDPRKVR